jgi:hypothetical protein
MATYKLALRRWVLAGGFAVAVAAAPAVAAIATPTSAAPSVAQCPAGESSDTFVNTCLPDLVPNSPEPGEVLPSVDNVPCTGGNSGQCIGLAESQGGAPNVVPHSTVSSSP